MATIALHNLEGKKIEDLNVSDLVFAEKPNDELLHQVFMIIAGNQRFSIANTKDKSEVAGTGKKPFKQKGTGNARQGQKRNPVMKGGGVAFGPTSDRNFKRDVNKKMKQKAVRIALSEKLRSGTLIAVDALEMKEVKTKAFSQIIKNLQLTGKTLVSFSEGERGLSIASRNLAKISNIETKDLNVYDLLNNKNVLLSKASIAFLEEKFVK
ncbi:MAG: 50S ribosomal protein L4 [Candidatus Moranbacteria bacterium]|nr:50S ribosomal protein L4 [Candidatus Moranbacteria bacterium]